ncbi:putative aldo-keto reductase 2 [Fusarium oxysporum f. sp. albedinis]|nr:putative aldo-keto reductase 2 [Fusarium oxysporum f. sp. albedinis]
MFSTSVIWEWSRVRFPVRPTDSCSHSSNFRGDLAQARLSLIIFGHLSSPDQIQYIHPTSTTISLVPVPASLFHSLVCPSLS